MVITPFLARDSITGGDWGCRNPCPVKNIGSQGRGFENDKGYYVRLAWIPQFSKERGVTMKHRTMLTILAFICLVAAIGLIKVRGKEESKNEPEKESGATGTGCFDVVMHPEYTGNFSGGNFSSGSMRVHTFAVLLDRCSGKTWLLIRDKNSQHTNRAWHPLHQYGQR